MTPLSPLAHSFFPTKTVFKCFRGLTLMQAATLQKGTVEASACSHLFCFVEFSLIFMIFQPRCASGADVFVLHTLPGMPGQAASASRSLPRPFYGCQQCKRLAKPCCTAGLFHFLSKVVFILMSGIRLEVAFDTWRETRHWTC